MNGRRRTLLAVLTVLVATACDGTNAFTGVGVGVGGLDTGTGKGNIFGQVTASGASQSGLRVVLTGRDSTLTDINGVFRFDSLTAGAYSVLLRVPSGFVLASGETNPRAVTVTSGNTSGANFHLVVP
jgi:hypothetical protein